ncbi:MAG TPA: peptide chain release factor N(5)-glutamine methyltransferase [Vicinamibacterales bacterium]|nr:peptide chain release factor N(5)-glutamine methyltransferase [Vicinamibacterales bacterium]
MTLHEVLRAARERLVAGGIAPDEAAVDVELYARTILGWDAARLLTERAASTPPALEPRFSEWIARRAQREPSAYIIGHREFWGLDYLVSPAVLIPRPESELIVEEALARLRDAEAPRLADVGTGSGCLGLSIAHDLPGARVVATDISREALAVARDNAVRLHVADRVMFLQTSYLDGVASAPFDAIVANPPYVKDTDKPALSRQVIAYEPHVALFGGDDGLRGVRGVLDAGRDRLRAGGWLITEFGLGQDEEVRELVGGYAMYRLESIKEDFQGIPRTAVIQRTIAP